MPREDARAHLAREWLIKAFHDRLAVEQLAETAPLGDIVAFHCQQAAEKALKAYLTWRDEPFRRIHDLEELVEQCRALDAAFGSLVPAARRLTVYAVDPRYPSDFSTPSPDDVRLARQLAEEVVAFVLARVSPSVRPS
jgi:HEPN domain-containing protein